MKISMVIIVVALAIGIPWFLHVRKVTRSYSERQGPLLFSCPYDDQRYLSTLPREQYNIMPSWNPSKDNSPPLSPGKALIAAKKMLEIVVPGKEWEVPRIELHPIEPDNPNGKWVYFVHYANPIVKHEKEEEGKTYTYTQKEFLLVVLMNGECLKPIQQPQKQER